MPSPLLTRALESQLTAEQPSTKKHCNLPKKIPYIQGQRGSHGEKVGGTQSWWNQVPYPQTGEQLYHRSSPTRVKVLSPTLGFSAWGSGNRRRSPQRIQLWRPMGFDGRTSTGLGETETPLLEGTHKVLCAREPRGKEQWPHRRLNETYLLVLEGLLQRRGAAVAHGRDKDTGSSSSGKYSLAWDLPQATISPAISL